MKTLSSFQFTNLIKSFTVFFIAITALWAAGNYIAIRDILVSWPVLAVNFLLSAALSWWYYRYRYHTVLSYDASGFDLQVGRRHTARRWTEFETVALVHRGHGEFAVRLYDDQRETPVDIPATALKLDAQQFRFEAMGFVRQPALRQDG